VRDLPVPDSLIGGMMLSGKISDIGHESNREIGEGWSKNGLGFCAGFDWQFWYYCLFLW
jgi:hypothetical protein